MTAMLRTLLRTLAAAAIAVLPALPAAAGTVTYFHNDLAGSPVVATDASGQVLWRESYRPYGERLTHSPAASGNTVWFTSRRQDAETGLVYMGARYYDPVAGRFVSPDPVGFEEPNLHSFNRYAYANNNPYRYKDPDGRAAETILDVVSFGISLEMFRRDPTVGNFIGAAVDGIAVAVPFLPGGVGSIRMIGKGAEAATEAARGSAAIDVAKVGDIAAQGSREAIQVTKSGVALPPGAKHQIPDSYVQNPHRSGSFGELADGKFKERLRIDPATPAGQKGPNYSHYHLEGKGPHYSPRPGDKDPGFGP
jgi:RHS repeat-associated protein